MKHRRMRWLAATALVVGAGMLARAAEGGPIWVVDTRADILKEVLPASCTYTIDDESLVTVTFGEDLVGVQCVLPDNMGPIAFNVNGKTIAGKTGSNGSATADGGAGAWTFKVGEGTTVTIVGTSGSISGGAGGWGKLGGAGGFAFVDATGAQLAVSGTATLVRQGAVGRTIIDVPEQLSVLVYNGDVQMVALSGYGYTIGGEISGTAAGSYTATVTPDDSHCWSDGTYEVKEVEWMIAPKSIDLAVVILGDPLAYTSKEQRQTIEAVKVGGLNVTYTVDGDCTTEKGEHELTITGTGNFTGTIKKKYGVYAVSVKARQRYPWNGLVDVDFTVDGVSDERYYLDFYVEDTVGGTNITVKTMTKADGEAVTRQDWVRPGAYRWVWNAAADLPPGWKSKSSLGAKLSMLSKEDK